jgi:hypothetical protein
MDPFSRSGNLILRITGTDFLGRVGNFPDVFPDVLVVYIIDAGASARASGPCFAKNHKHAIRPLPASLSAA